RSDRPRSRAGRARGARPAPRSDRGAPLLRWIIRSRGRGSHGAVAIDGNSRVADGPVVALPADERTSADGCAVTDTVGWERVKQVFQEALARPPQERAACLHELCGD